MFNTKLWKLYLLPLLIVGFVLAAEQFDSYTQRIRSFESIAQETNALAAIDSREMEEVLVSKVVDGDTMEIDTGEKVRFIGVDTSETVHPDKPVQCYGREASRRTKELLEGKRVFIETDISDTDRYNRLLRYIYLPNPEASDEAIFINEYLIEHGFGRVITYPPDVKYHDIFLDAQRLAQKEERGLWGACKF